jgi:hypothetical protein
MFHAAFSCSCAHQVTGWKFEPMEHYDTMDYGRTMRRSERTEPMPDFSQTHNRGQIGEQTTLGAWECMYDIYRRITN